MISLIAVKAPEFQSGMQDKTATIGGTFELEAKVSGEPFPEVKWYHNHRLFGIWNL